MRRALRAATGALLLLVAACGDAARLFAPGREGAPATPARVSMRTSIAAQVGQGGEPVELRVAASYLRRGGERVPISQQQLALSGERVQAVPIPVDVGTCLADPARDAVAGDGCPAILALALVVDRVVVDEQVIGPLALRPGATTVMPEPVTLFEIARVELARLDGSALGDAPTVVEGRALPLVARVLDAQARAVVDRAVTWQSSDPTVATVDASGLVRGVRVGTVRISAAIGTIRTDVAIRIARAPMALAIASGARGRGTIRSQPAGIECTVVDGTLTGSCRAEFPGDSVITLVADAAASNRWEGWTDDCATATGVRCEVRMSAPRTVGARFTVLRRVHVSAGSGDGTGVITSEPAGIRCAVAGGSASGDCTMEVPEGTVVLLRAAGASDAPVAQRFAGWGGDCATATGDQCTVTAFADRALTAGFHGGRTLTVHVVGNGGRVNGPGIDCTATTGACSTTVAHGTVLALHASASTPAQFDGWSGCAATETTCTVTMTGTVDVTARFSVPSVPLTLSLDGSGGGSVQVDGQPACTRAVDAPPVTCALTLPRGSTVTVRATPAAGARFDGFEAACGDQPTCTFVLSAARTVTATFTRTTVPLTLVLAGTGAGEVRVNGTVACVRTGTATVTCETMVPTGRTVTLTATPGPTMGFGGFSTPCGSAPTCTVSMDGARTVTATFHRPITVSIMGVAGATGAGRVVGVTPTIADCNYSVQFVGGPICEVTGFPGTSVLLRATPSAGSIFLGWQGACTTTSEFCVFTLGPATPPTVSARFTAFVTLELQVTGGGQLRIEGVGPPALAPCVGTPAPPPVLCRYSLPAGSTVRLTAVASTGFVLLPNGSDPCFSGGICSFTLTAARRVAAVFRQPP
ncbi:MAG: Ig-like domain-containing protein [Gemmatimonadaceae bacterium]|nr:Ig-like domain-containing protein [Gemmatimonadaceae bacterium]